MKSRQATRKGDLQRAAANPVRRIARRPKRNWQQAERAAWPMTSSAAHVEGRSGRGRHRAHRLQVDRHSGLEDARRRGQEAGADGGPSAPARGGTGRSAERVANAIRRSRAGLERSEAADRLVHLPGPDGRGQDGKARALAEFLFDDEQRWFASTCPSTWRSMRWRG